MRAHAFSFFTAKRKEEQTGTHKKKKRKETDVKLKVAKNAFFFHRYAAPP